MTTLHWHALLKGPPEVPDGEYAPDEPVEPITVLDLQCSVREHRQHPPLGFTAPIAPPVHIVRFEWTDYTGKRWSGQWFVDNHLIECVQVPFLLRRVDIADKGLVELGLDVNRDWLLLLQYEGYSEGKPWLVPPLLPDSASVRVNMGSGT